MGKPHKRMIQADGVQWIGLCPCGCGTYRAALVDEQGGEIAVFGWSRMDWFRFMAGVAEMLDEERDGVGCDHQTH